MSRICCSNFFLNQWNQIYAIGEMGKAKRVSTRTAERQSMKQLAEINCAVPKGSYARKHRSVIMAGLRAIGAPAVTHFTSALSSVLTSSFKYFEPVHLINIYI